MPLEQIMKILVNKQFGMVSHILAILLIDFFNDFVIQ